MTYGAYLNPVVLDKGFAGWCIPSVIGGVNGAEEDDDEEDEDDEVSESSSAESKSWSEESESSPEESESDFDVLVKFS